MPRAVLVVQSRPSSPDREQEYLDWYRNVHIPEICQVPGILSGRHFRVSDVQIGGATPDPSLRPYLAIYEIDADDVGEVLKGMAQRDTEGKMTRSEALQLDPPPITTCYVQGEA